MHNIYARKKNLVRRGTVLLMRLIANRIILRIDPVPIERSLF